MTHTTPGNTGRSAIYGGGFFYDGGQADMDILRSSGFTTVVFWSIHVDTNGDLYLNDSKIISTGEYVGNAGWPALVKSLKRAPTSVTRIEFSVGAGGTPDWEHIQALVEQGGTGPDSVLYRNFRVLYEITGADAINDDDESCYDVNSTVQFARMAQTIGYQNFTIVPYTYAEFWGQVKNSLGPYLDRAYLQCYSGGSGNDPQSWREQLGMPIDPGLWCRNGPDCGDGDSPAEFRSTMGSWHRDAGVPGGFLWLYDDVMKCQPATGYTVADYAAAINQATSASTGAAAAR
jgi:hypothetical protein